MKVFCGVLAAVSVAYLSGCATGHAGHDFVVYLPVGVEPLMVDRSTGRAWHLVCDGKVDANQRCTALVWESVYVEGVTPAGDRTSRQFFARHPGLEYR